MWFKSRKPAQPEPDLRVELKNDLFWHVDAGIYSTQEPNRYQGFTADIFPHTLTAPSEFVMTLPVIGEQSSIRVVFKTKRQYIRRGIVIGWIYDGYLLENNSYTTLTHEFVVIAPEYDWSPD